MTHKTIDGLRKRLRSHRAFIPDEGSQEELIARLQNREDTIGSQLSPVAHSVMNAVTEDVGSKAEKSFQIRFTYSFAAILLIVLGFNAGIFIIRDAATPLPVTETAKSLETIRLLLNDTHIAKELESAAQAREIQELFHEN